MEIGRDDKNRLMAKKVPIVAYSLKGGNASTPSEKRNRSQCFGIICCVFDAALQCNDAVSDRFMVEDGEEGVTTAPVPCTWLASRAVAPCYTCGCPSRLEGSGSW